MIGLSEICHVWYQMKWHEILSINFHVYKHFYKKCDLTILPYIVFVKQEKVEKKTNKAYYGKNENVTHVNVFVGGTFPLTYIVFYPT